MAVQIVQGRFGDFEPYRLSGIEVKRRRLGRGSYAAVLELEYKGLKCAGKRIFRILLKVGNADAEDIVRRFENECRLLSQTRHPNIVQFLGVYFEENRGRIEEDEEDDEEYFQVPILVMEFLPTNLASCIDRYGVLPPEISYSILYDVALGLYYLHSHSPPIIHRDLSANNILLTDSMTAKISDLGVARIVNLHPRDVTRLSRVPGTLAFMPPEVFEDTPIYGPSMDIYSYGIILIHVFSGKWPLPLFAFLEAERQDKCLGVVGHAHPLKNLILDCVKNSHRPTALAIIQQMKTMVKQFTLPTHANRIEMLQQLQVDTREKQSLRTEVERLAGEVEQKDKEIAHLRRKSQEAREEVVQLNDILQTSQREADHLATEIKDKQAEIWKNQAQIVRLRRQKEAEVAAKQAEISTKNREIQRLTQESQRITVAQLNDALQTSRREAEQLATEVEDKREEIRRNQGKHQTQIADLRRQKEAEVEAKEAEISTKSREIQRMRQEVDQLATKVAAESGRNQGEHQAQIADLRRQREAEDAAKEAEISEKNQGTRHLQQDSEESRAELTDTLRISRKDSHQLNAQKQIEVSQGQKETEVAVLGSQLQVEKAEPLSTVDELSSKDRLDRELAEKIATLRRMDRELASKNAMLERKSAIILSLNDQLSQVQGRKMKESWQRCLRSPLNLGSAVKLPKDVDLIDWVTLHIVDFFNRIDVVYGTVCEFCTDQTCPIMSGGPKFEYYWADETHKKPQALPANQYITKLMEWVEKHIKNGSPSIKLCKKILTRLYRVFVHVYIHHFDKMVASGAEAHVTSCYKHFYYFVAEFNLVDPKEFEPLRELTHRICR